MRNDEAATEAQRIEPIPARGSSWELVVAQGTDAGAKLEIAPDSPRKLVGKSRLCDFCLDDGEVSRRHLAVESTPRGLLVRDVGSTNGTFFGGVRIESATFAGGETIVLGQTHLLVRRVADVDRALSRAMRFGRVLGASPAMRKCYPILKRLSTSHEPVLLEGEEGTGKELVAEALHEESDRSSGPFVVLDCSGQPSADALRAALQQAAGGTIVLDEVGELDAALQLALNAALDAKTVDARVIATSRRDLEQAITEGRFREDLYYRLAVAHVELPPLRDRAGDVELLARHFWSKLGGAGEIPATTLDSVVRASWPGNVRELRNAIARVIADVGAPAAATPEAQEAASAAELFAKVLGEDLTLPVARQRIVAAFEQRYIEHALAKAGGNVSAAAAASGVARRYFYIVKNRARGR